MAKLTQFILDGTFDAETGNLRLYEMGRALNSAFSVYNEMVSLNGYDSMWGQELRAVQNGLADRFFRMPLDNFGRFEPRVQSFGTYNPTGLWESFGLYPPGYQTNMLVTSDPATHALINSLEAANMMVLDSFPLINAMMWDKAAFFTLMDFCGAGAVLPKQKLYLRNNRALLAPQIKEDWPDDDILILKTPDVQNGEGVALYDPDAKREQQTHAVPLAFTPISDPAFPIGIKPRNKIFDLLALSSRYKQTYHPLLIAQEITNGTCHEGCQPTFRATVSLWQEEGGEVKYELHPAYWKFPKEKMNGVMFRDALLSDSSMPGQMLSESERQRLGIEILTHLLPAWQRLITMNSRIAVQTLLDDTDPAKQVMGLMLFANHMVFDRRSYTPRNAQFRQAVQTVGQVEGLETLLTRENWGGEREHFLSQMRRFAYAI